jgi:hypothetical protein
VLETDDKIISVAHDDHVARCLAPSPALSIQVENVEQVDIGKQRRNYAPYAKGNFSFERVICDWRTRIAVLDLRLKK